MRKFTAHKHNWIVPLYAIIYVILFRIIETRNVYNFNEIRMNIDTKIPFVEYFIIPYFLWFVYMGVAIFFFMFVSTRVKDYYRYLLSLGIGMTLFLVISFVYPNGQHLRPVIFERDNIFVDMVRHLYKVDTPTNIFPSIHVFNSVATFIAINHCRDLKKYKGLRIGALTLTVLIVLSTMFLKQHSVADVIAALALNSLLYATLYLPQTIALSQKKKAAPRLPYE